MLLHPVFLPRLLKALKHHLPGQNIGKIRQDILAAIHKSSFSIPENSHHAHTPERNPFTKSFSQAIASSFICPPISLAAQITCNIFDIVTHNV